MSRADLDDLLDEAIRFAQMRQSEQGEFYPFAITRDAEGEGAMKIAGIEPDRDVSAEMVKLLGEHLLQDARSGKIRAVALCYDVLFAEPAGPAKEAIRVDLEDETHSVTVLLPYWKTFLGRRKYGDLFSNSREPRFFGPVTSA